MQSNAQTVVVLGTGGTIAGKAADAGDNVGYTAGQVGVQQLVQAVPALALVPLEMEQVAQLDSKDMSHEVWRTLALRCEQHLARPEVAGVVITHGTDTMEETAWFLQRVLAPGKPVVITGAMRPSTALLRDGPQNLLDAVAVVRSGQARGVVAVMSGQVHAAQRFRKVHAYRVDAFDSGDAGPLAVVEEGAVKVFGEWPRGEALGTAVLGGDAMQWPQVEVVTSHAGAGVAVVKALVSAGVKGLVVACTGNGTIHRDMEEALIEANRQGLAVLRSTRTGGRILPTIHDSLPSADELPPAKARVELLLRLLSA
ncbi:asparaginase [Piscinibacter terrae]|uniref:Asparaginase n=1 Tax=Piscinibacter terrae TaxID=2496871 RepID=A0A3N7HNU4_9BURK|nr:asparaginase [Albitalea terrae]RQP23790.1 asparaginase [Albitalea terrae]